MTLVRKASIASIVWLAACGGSAAMTTPASTEARPSDTAAPDANQVQSVQSIQARPPEVAGARHDLDDAEGRVNAALNDCAAACRALASMERAAEHLCALESGNECGRARDRVEAARARVREHCGGCSQ